MPKLAPLPATDEEQVLDQVEQLLTGGGPAAEWLEQQLRRYLDERSGDKRPKYTGPWDMPPFLTAEQAAEVLGTTRKTIYELKGRGLLPVAQFGSFWRVERDALYGMVRKTKREEE